MVINTHTQTYRYGRAHIIPLDCLRKTNTLSSAPMMDETRYIRLNFGNFLIIKFPTYYGAECVPQVEV